MEVFDRGGWGCLQLNVVVPVLAVIVASIQPGFAIRKWRERTVFRKSNKVGDGMINLKLVAPLAFAVLAVTAASIEPALAGATVPAPVIGAGLPVLAVLGGGYWLIRKLRARS